MYVLKRSNTVCNHVTQDSECGRTAEWFRAADQIDKQTLEIAQADDEVYNNMQELANELPGHSPRFVLLSYPLTLVGLLET